MTDGTQRAAMGGDTWLLLTQRGYTDHQFSLIGMPTMKRTRTILFTALLTLSGQTLAADLKPGKWEVKRTITSELPPGMDKETTDTECLSAKQADDMALTIRQASLRNGCSSPQFQRDGKSLEWQTQCTSGNRTLSVDGSMTINSDERYNAAISTCEKGGQWELALTLLETMCKKRVWPDTTSYSAAISACEKSKQWEGALVLLTSKIMPIKIKIFKTKRKCGGKSHKKEEIDESMNSEKYWEMMTQKVFPAIIKAFKNTGVREVRVQQDGAHCHTKKKKNGVHTLGQASDILISGERAMLLFEKARKIGFSGIGLSQRGPHQDRFVHLDTKPRKALWSY